MNNSGGWGIWVNSNNAFFTPAEMSSLGLTPGNGYTFFMDMKIETGAPNNTLGRIKFEWAGVGGGTDEFVRTLIGDGTTWERYTYNVVIPAGATGLKVVPVISGNSFVGFDNIGFESVPYFVGTPPPPPPPAPTDVVHQNTFEVAGTNWGAPTGTPGPTSSVVFSGGEGNPPGSTILTVNKPAAGAADVFINYTVAGVDFGDGPVEISFDGKLLAPFPGTALHVRYNGNFVGAIQGSFNNSTYTTFKRTFNLIPDFSATNTFTLQFQFSMGPDPGAGGSIAIDNIVVKTNLPASAPPTTASIETGKLVDWDATNPDNSYQPQESATNNGLDWTNVGAPITNPAISSAFDNTPSAFYRVRETSPAILDNQVFNPGFEFTTNAPANGWNTILETLGTVTIQQSYPGGYLPTGGSNMLVLDVRTSSGTSGPGSAEIRSDQFSVTEGETYNFSFNAANPITSGVSGAPQYAIYFYDFVGTIIETPIIGLLREPPHNVTEEWTRVERSVVIPADVTGVQIGFALPTGPLPSEVFVTLIDDVSFDTGDVITPSVTSTIPSTANPAVKVSWQTVTGRDYQVKSSTTLVGWDDFGSSVAGDGSIFSVTDLITPPRKFYRVEETTP